MSIEIIETEFNPTQIKVIGIGGGGCNAIDRMILAGMQHVTFIATNTDAQALRRSRAEKKIQLGVNLTRGLGAGANPHIGKEAAEEQLQELEKALKGTDVLFLTAGMGGGTGTGASTVIAQLARKLGCLTIAIVTKPFYFEMGARMQNALAGIKKLQPHVDTLITIPNQNLLNLRGRNLSISEAFKEADSVLMEGVKGISDLILKSGFVNVDFADIRTVMKDKGNAILSVLEVTNDMPAPEIAKNILNNPLLERTNIRDAKAILINISYGKNVLLSNIDKIIQAITEQIDSNATCIHGFIANPTYNDELKLTMIATGFSNFATEQSPVSDDVVKNHPAHSKSSFQESLTDLKARVEAATDQSHFKRHHEPHVESYEENSSDEDNANDRRLFRQPLLNNDKVYTFSADGLDKRPTHPQNLYENKESTQTSTNSKERQGPHSPLERKGSSNETLPADDLEIPTFLRIKRKLDL
ncbi:cell division protein FtsZ [Spirochaetota bacterium]|nr:cell division protein FtsZ [Spirochaetota bacterium]